MFRQLGEKLGVLHQTKAQQPSGFAVTLDLVAFDQSMTAEQYEIIDRTTSEEEVTGIVNSATRLRGDNTDWYSKSWVSPQEQADPQTSRKAIAGAVAIVTGIQMGTDKVGLFGMGQKTCSAIVLNDLGKMSRVDVTAPKVMKTLQAEEAVGAILEAWQDGRILVVRHGHKN